MRFESLEEIVGTGKINLSNQEYYSRLLAVVIVDSLNHEEQPALYESFMKRSSYIYTHEKLYIGFEEEQYGYRY